MGVSGSGKSTVGAAVAAHLAAATATAVPFADADGFHPTVNLAKMAAGVALTDDDRWGWLHRTGQWLADRPESERVAIVACSALRVAYRDVLREHVPDAFFVHLALDLDTARARMGDRPGHFMPAALAESQCATLEPLSSAERGLTLATTAPLAETVGAVASAVAIAAGLRGDFMVAGRPTSV